MRYPNKIIRISSIVCILAILSIIVGIPIYRFIETAIPRYKIYPVTYINSILIEGVPFKGEPIKVIIEYDLPTACDKPYSQESDIDNVSKVVEFTLMEIRCINRGCLPAFASYTCNMSITLQLAGEWILKAGDVSVNISVIE